MLPILQIGPFAIQTPGLIYLAGLWIGLSLSERSAATWKVNPEKLYNLTLIALVAGVLGARLAYAGRFPAAFTADPASLISLNPGLLDPVGGLVVAAIAAYVYIHRNRLPFWSTLDGLTPLLAVLLIAEAAANLASGAHFGLPTDLPWAIELWGARRHPAQIYDLLAAVAILFAIRPARVKRISAPPGAYFAQFVTLAAFARLLLEAFRADSLVIFGSLRLAQLIAWAIAASGLALLYARAARKRG